jgi:CRISPR system Cascade subunit CasC
MEKFLELHVLQNYAPSNLNRDDTGAPKDCFFGGYRRARISSQCQKSAIRKYFKNLIQRDFLSPCHVGVRTRLIYKELQCILEKEYKKPIKESKNKIKSALALVGLKLKSNENAQYLLFLKADGISLFAKVINDYWDKLDSVRVSNDEGGEEDGDNEEDVSDENEKDNKNDARTTESKNKKITPKELDELKIKLNSAIECGEAIDIALFGRMLANMPKQNQNAACQVAHAISTHRVEVDYDYFTAVDELQPAGEPAAGMIDTFEFNSACFYRYALVDYRKLTDNLQNDGKLASRAVEAFTRGFICTEPSGKQNSFAAHNPPKFVMASVRSNSAPWNLANAFEIPVRPVMDPENGFGLTELSAKKLLKEAKSLKEMYGFDGKCLFLNACQVEVGEAGDTLESLNDLVGRIVGELEA